MKCESLFTEQAVYIRTRVCRVPKHDDCNVSSRLTGSDSGDDDDGSSRFGAVDGRSDVYRRFLAADGVSNGLARCRCPDGLALSDDTPK